MIRKSPKHSNLYSRRSIFTTARSNFSVWRYDNETLERVYTTIFLTREWLKQPHIAHRLILLDVLFVRWWTRTTRCSRWFHRGSCCSHYLCSSRNFHWCIRLRSRLRCPFASWYYIGWSLCFQRWHSFSTFIHHLFTEMDGHEQQLSQLLALWWEKSIRSYRRRCTRVDYLLRWLIFQIILELWHRQEESIWWVIHEASVSTS